MNALITALVSRPRPVLTVMVLLLLAGIISYATIPKEAEPDIAIPQMYINVIHEGISPEDAERMIIRPLETELRTLEGLDEMRATASEGSGVLILEFEAGFDADQALSDVRERVDLARPELPSDSEEPFVQEVSMSQFPVLIVMLHGELPERTLVSIARDLRDKIEGIAGVLDAEVGGDREELLEVNIDPAALESYQLSYGDIINFVSLNNRLVAAGAMDTGNGRFSVKVPGVVESMEDLLNMPIKVSGQRTVTIQDVATVKRTYKDPESYARLNGNSAIGLEITKRAGANIIELVDGVKALLEREKVNWPPGLQVTTIQDNSRDVRIMLNDLVNNVAVAVLLVMVVIMGALGFRSAGLVGISIPGSFLSGIFIIYMIGYSMNIVVLFSLIMAVGMLVDGAIVVVELAERNLQLGYAPRLAYMQAAKRMAWPITASTATTLAAFMPLVFWPGILGEFMKYLPVTLLVTLSMSLIMALFFVPTFGALLRARQVGADEASVTRIAETDLLQEARDTLHNHKNKFVLHYLALLRTALRHPVKVVFAALGVLGLTVAAYSFLGKGVEFFPEIEPEVAAINIHARGDLSVQERDALVRQVEQRIVDMPEYASVYTRSGVRLGNDMDEDIIGRIQLQFIDWELRRPAQEILDEVRERTADLAGIIVEPETQESGITAGKPIQIELSAANYDLLPEAIEDIRRGMRELGGFIDVTDSRPLPGIDWRIEVDREQAARFGTDISSIGSAVQLLTNGILISDYRPDNADDEVDIRVRFPEELRNLEQLEKLTVGTPMGNVPIGNFISRVPAQRVGSLERTDGVRVMTIAADVEEGLLVNDKVTELQAWLEEGHVNPNVNVLFRGENQDQAEAEAFLSKAFGAALFLMAIILVTQFNSFYQTFLILTAVGFSTVGVFIALLVTGQPFGVVMCGIGVIALAGIVVNNNIVLIDTFNQIRSRGAAAVEAAVLTCAQRLRPVVLTTVTTILGLLPMATGMSFDLVNRHIEFGGPSTQWWNQLATAIVGGLAFATLLTLILTPCLLVLGEKMSRKHKKVPVEEPGLVPG